MLLNLFSNNNNIYISVEIVFSQILLSKSQVLPIFKLYERERIILLYNLHWKLNHKSFNKRALETEKIMKTNNTHAKQLLE